MRMPFETKDEVRSSEVLQPQDTDSRRMTLF